MSEEKKMHDLWKNGAGLKGVSVNLVRIAFAERPWANRPASVTGPIAN
jgi:hypothetical protein